MNKKQKLIKENLENRDLFIINVQPAMENRIYFDLKEFGAWLKGNGNSFRTIFFFYDGDTHSDEKEAENPMKISEWYEKTLQIEDGFVSVPFRINNLREYFGKLLESNYTDEDIIKVFKYMLSKNFDKVQNMMPEDIQSLEINEEFKQNLLDNKFDLIMPYDLLKVFKTSKNPFIVGGLNHSSLRMFKILLETTNTTYSISNKWVY